MKSKKVIIPIAVVCIASVAGYRYLSNDTKVTEGNYAVTAGPQVLPSSMQIEEEESSTDNKPSESNSVIKFPLNINTLRDNLYSLIDEGEMYFDYIDESNAIGVVLDSYERKSKTAIIYADSDCIYVLKSSDVNDLSEDNIVTSLSLYGDLDYEYICNSLLESLRVYKEYLLTNYPGDSMDYGESVEIVRNPDGTFSNKKG